MINSEQGNSGNQQGSNDTRKISIDEAITRAALLAKIIGNVFAEIEKIAKTDDFINSLSVGTGVDKLAKPEQGWFLVDQVRKTKKHAFAGKLDELIIKIGIDAIVNSKEKVDSLKERIIDSYGRALHMPSHMAKYAFEAEVQTAIKNIVLNIDKRQALSGYLKPKP